MATLDVFTPGKSGRPNWYNLAFDDSDETASLYVYDYIGAFGVMAKDLIEQVNTIGAKSLKVFINSMGGEVYEGLAIHSFLSRFAGDVTVYIDGMAASIASVIAMAGKTVVMPKSSMMFLHNPWTMMAGDAKDLQKEAANLDKMKVSLVSAYAAKSGLSDSEIEKLMDAETLLTAQEAVNLGFADAIEEPAAQPQAAYNSALYSKVLCAMAQKMTNKEQNSMTDENKEPEAEAVAVAAAEPVAEAVAEDESKPEASEPVAEVVEESAAPVAEEQKVEAEPVDHAAVARAEFAKYCDRFGDVRAAAYFKEGLAFADAERRFTDELIEENARLKAAIPKAESKVGPVAVKTEEPKTKKPLFKV